MKNFEITKEQVLQLSKNNAIQYQLKQWFPEAFNFELEVNTWYKWQELLFFMYEVENVKLFYYGIDDGVWIKKDWINIDNDFIHATPEEVEIALIKEAKKRGFEVGVIVDPPQKMWSRKLRLNLGINEIKFTYRNNELLCCGVQVFYKGKWANIIPTMTKQEAEEKLNCKIV